jgi:hypothetical protein
METSIKKWKHILNNGRVEHHLNIPTYKDKWGFLYGDCKKKKHNYKSGQDIMKNIGTCL